MPKHSLRRLMLAKRRELSPSEVTEASLAIVKAFMASTEFLLAGTLALYAPIYNEVDTTVLQRQSLLAGKKVVYPAVDGDSLTFRPVRAATDLVKGAFGIDEPGGSDSPCPPSGIDIFIIPGVAFDLTGRRVGYGKGFYDRTLHELEGQGRFIGFCYDFQLIEEITGEPHDVPMDLIFTETRIIRP